MNRSVFWALVRKDLYLRRAMIIAILVVGLGSLVLASFGGRAFAVGGLLFLTANVAGGLFMAALSLFGERRALARGFALSLPVSGRYYDLSKLVSGFLAFGIPWLVLTVAAVGGMFLPGGMPGIAVYALLIQLFVIAQFAVVLAAYSCITSEAVSGVVILFVNVALSLFMMQINQPEILGPWRGDAIVWTPFARVTLLAELAVIAVAVAFTYIMASRRRDYI